ncbi:hypothetical protein FA95DRAFT_1567797 [Auriscalpium vulgare]|uniref:Uncharacterized protein n=1 Tax=Auriscalpium vulgare TaxID=40419 RepID=A0ACB8R2K1_9AGAM|nr:hypothetical protein FA95DRAFT_1567797 [Auriscalpium vulgare]
MALALARAARGVAMAAARYCTCASTVPAPAETVLLSGSRPIRLGAGCRRMERERQGLNLHMRAGDTDARALWDRTCYSESSVARGCRSGCGGVVGVQFLASSLFRPAMGGKALQQLGLAATSRNRSVSACTSWT